MLFDQFGPMIQAAISGLGSALWPSYIAHKEIAGGSLASILKSAVEGHGPDRLVCSAGKPDYPHLETFLRRIEKAVSEDLA